MATGPEINTMLTISTAHISPQTREEWQETLDTNSYQTNEDFVIYGKDGYGFFMYITNKTGEHTTNKTLKKIIEFAVDYNADIICFDSDGPTIDSLKKYED